MRTEKIILFGLMLFISVSSFIISILQFKEKGFLFNNAYIYASKKERETMYKKPFYRQSAIVFLFIGIMFLIMGVEIFLHSNWMYLTEIVVVISVIVYAVVSSAKIERKK